MSKNLLDEMVKKQHVYGDPYDYEDPPYVPEPLGPPLRSMTKRPIWLPSVLWTTAVITFAGIAGYTC